MTQSGTPFSASLVSAVTPVMEPDVRQAGICDRDSKWSGGAQRLLEPAGVRVIRTPAHAPNCNAHAERFVRSIKEEYLNCIVPLGEQHFLSNAHSVHARPLDMLCT